MIAAMPRHIAIRQGNGPVDGAYDFGEGDRLRIAGDTISAPNASMGTQKAFLSQQFEDLAHRRKRDLRLHGDLSCRQGFLALADNEVPQDNEAVIRQFAHPNHDVLI